jgi:hypothetical protein
MSNKNKELKAQASAARIADALPLITGKTIESTRWTNKEGNGYADLEISFTDGTAIKVHYSCMGGVYVEV